MPNAVEPPSESPTRLEAAYALLADGTGPAWRPVAGGTDLMVQVTGEIGEPPERVLDIWGLDELRGITVETDALVLGALTTYTEIRQSPLVAEFLPALVQAAGDDRRGADPEPRHDRRQRRQRLARRRHPAGAAGLRRGDGPRLCRRRANRAAPMTSGPRTARPPAATTSYSSGCGSRWRGTARCGSRRSAPASPGDQQGRHGARLARDE